MRGAVGRIGNKLAVGLVNYTPIPIRTFLGDHKLAIGITGAIIIAIIQTVISVGLYVNSSTYGLDLSRPEFERAKQEVKPHAPQVTFDSTGPITPAVLDEFNQLYQEQVKTLNNSGRYEGTPLGDAELRFTPETANEQSPEDPSP